MMKHIKKFAMVFLFSAMSILVVAGIDAMHWLRPWEDAMYSRMTRWTAEPTPQEVSDDIRLVLIDRGSLLYLEETEGVSWPWPKVLYADLLRYLRHCGAKVIMVDMFFDKGIDDDVHDTKDFGNELKEHDHLVMALVLRDDEERQEKMPPYIKLKQGQPLVKTHMPGLREYDTAIYPHAEIGSGIKRYGHVLAWKDSTGIATGVRPYLGLKGGVYYPRMEYAGVEAGLAKDELDANIRIWAHKMLIGDYKIPVNTEGVAHLRFRARQDEAPYHGFAYKTYTAQDILQSWWNIRAREDGDTEAPPPVIDPSEFKDKYVIIGVSAAAGYDFHATPMDKVTPGPHLVATSLDNILSGDFLTNSPVWIDYPWMFVLAMIGGLLVVLVKRAWVMIPIFLAAICIPTLTGTLSFSAGFYMPVISPTLALALTLLASGVYSYATEGAQKRFIKKAFSHYISPVVVNQIVKNPDLLQLGGERRELSIFFSDLQGFSSISEGMDPTDLIAMLNDYLTEMVAILREENGTLDKFEGDAIIAFWNAPLDEKEHHIRSVRCALRCQQRLTERNSDFNKMCGRDLKMRIGINTGPVVVGNMGGKDRFDYSMLGNAANLAARLEGANKAFGTLLMISEWTYEGCKDEIIARETALIRVVGIEQPVRVYEPLVLAGEPRPDWLDDYEVALAHVRAGDLEVAVNAFKALPDDPVAQTYLKKIAMLKEAGETTWDGIFNLTEK